MGVTQAQLAKITGISQGTVSRCFSEPHMVKEATLERVLNTAGQLGYKVNSAAQGMRKGRFGTIGLLNDEARYRTALPRDLLGAMYATCTDRQQRMSFAQLPDVSFEEPDVAPTILRDLCVDGIIVNYHGLLPPRLERYLVNTGLPAVWLNSLRDYDCVRPDDLQAGRLATETLLQAGHQVIAFADLEYNRETPFGRHHCRMQRFNGYRDAMEHAGYRSHFLSRKAPNSTFAEKRNYALQVLQQTPEISAVVASGLRDASFFSWAAMHLDTDFPRRLSIISFDEGSQLCGYELSYVTPCWDTIGAKVITMLMEKIEGPDLDLPTINVPCIFHAGETIDSKR